MVLSRRANLVCTLVVLLLSLQGCAHTSTLYSNTFIKPTTHLKKLNVI